MQSKLVFSDEFMNVKVYELTAASTSTFLGA